MQPEYYDPDEEVEYRQIEFDGETEEVAVKQVAENQFLIQSFVHGSSEADWGDVIEVEEKNDQALAFVNVAEKSDWLLEGMEVGSDFPESPFEQQLQDEVFNLGGYCETRDSSFYVALPPNAGVSLEEIWSEASKDEAAFMGEEE